MSDDQTARLGLPYLAAGQMQKHVTLNEALTRLDALVQTTVVSRTLTTQPADPPDGGLYILPPGATGAAWAGRPEGALLRAEAGGWAVVATSDGLVVLVADAGELIVRHGGAWVPLGARLNALQGLVRLGLGTTADVANPFAARLNKALWTALESGGGGDGDLRMTFNKEGPSDVLSLLFQSGWGGRAELGLIGDDDFRLKVCADGGDWRNACAVDRSSGRVSFDLGAVRRETTVLNASGSYPIPAWARTVEAIAIGGGGGGGGGVFGAVGDRLGGGGGGAGGVSRATWSADQLMSDLTVTVGAGGAGGGGGDGGDGGGSIIHLGATALLTAAGGAGGVGGSGGGSGAAGSNAGGASSVSQAGDAGRSLDRPDAPGGGGGGGGLDAAGVARAGGAGGDGAALAVAAPGGSAGPNVPGGAGSASPRPELHWAGGGGGGGGASAAGAGQAGGAGGGAGGGGGGGGAGTTAGGAGGPGAGGRVWLIAEG